MKKLFGRWHFWNYHHIYDQRDGSVYLWRLRIFGCPWFGIMLHRIMGPDFGRDMHDHPWPFFSIVLLGSYHEEVPSIYYGYGRTQRVSWINFKRATSLHRITHCSRKPVWTLVFRGPRVRTWGFETAFGWKSHREYYGMRPWEEDAESLE